MDKNKRSGKVLIQALHGDTLEPLRCILFQSFKLTWEQNSTYQIEFTAIDDGSQAYKDIDSESTVYFNGQQFKVKQPVFDHAGLKEMKSVTALHISNEVSRVHQYDIKAGTLTYTVEDVLQYFLAGNQLGYTYNVYGNFPKAQITNLGNGSGKAMLTQIISAWPDAIFYPDNRAINIYTPDAFHADLGNRIIYRRDTSEIKLTKDTTSMANIVKVIGKQKDDSDADNPSYYFAPHLVKNLDSIKRWGEFPAEQDLSDDRFSDPAAMDAYANTALVVDPVVTLDVVYSGNDEPRAGETRRLEIKEKNWFTNVNIVSYVWYPFDKTQNTALTFNNAPANFLDTKNSIQDLQNAVQELTTQTGYAEAAANGKNHNWYTATDPSLTNKDALNVGDIWYSPDGSDIILKVWNGIKWIDVVSTKMIATTYDIAQQNKKDADQMRADVEASFKQVDLDIAAVTKNLNDIDAKFDDKTDATNQAVKNAQAQIDTQIENLKAVKINADQALANTQTINQTVKTISGEIDDVNASLKLKAEQTDVDTINKTVKNQQTEIDANTQAIELKAEKSDVDNINQTVSDQQAQLKILAGEVDEKTSKTDFNGLTGRVTDAEQQIKANADGVSSTVSRVDKMQNQLDKTATVEALNVVKQTADETYQGLFNADGSNKIDKTAQGLTAQIKTAQDNAESYAETTMNAKAGELSAKLVDVQGQLDDTAVANNLLFSTDADFSNGSGGQSDTPSDSGGAVSGTIVIDDDAWNTIIGSD